MLHAKYELLFINASEKGIYAGNRIYIPNLSSLALRILGIISPFDGIIAGTISKEG